MNIYRILPLVSSLFIFTSSFAQVTQWSEDFSTAVPLNTSTSGLEAADWYVGGAGVTNSVEGAGITLDTDKDQVVLSAIKVGNSGSAGAVQLGAYGQGTSEGRRVAAPDHEVTWVFDLISFRSGQADLTVRSRGLDGYVQLLISPSGRVKFSHWHSNYNFKQYYRLTGPAEFRNNTSTNANNDPIVITSGGTFDGSGGVTVVIDPPALSSELGGVTATAEVVMNAENTAVDSVTFTDFGWGYADEPAVTFNGGGVTVQPTFTFNFETGNGEVLAPGVTGQNTGGTNGDRSSSSNKWAELGTTMFNDGNTFTLVQSYDGATDTISYYYGLNDDPVTNLMMTVEPATNSAGGYGFYNVVTGNKYSGNPQNKDAVFLRYQQWGAGTAQVGFNSYALEFTDKDGDGVINRLDWAPEDGTETKDTDGDGVGDNGDVHPGYNDGTLGTYLGTWLTDNNYILDDGSTGGLTEQDLSDLRLGSTMIDASSGSATITFQVEESSDLSTWTDMGTEGEATVTVPISGDATFFRVRAQ